MLEVVLVQIGLHDGVHRARFLAKAAEDALEQVDVVPRRATGPVLSFFRVDGDGQRRADRLAQLAGDAALLAVGVTAQSVQATETGGLWSLFLRVLDRELALEEVAQGYTCLLYTSDAADE